MGTSSAPGAGEHDVPAAPPLPPGRSLVLPGRGTTFVRELPGPSIDAPTLLLLHGWTATADLNWFTVYAPLARHARVIALDHRGHGRGIRSRRPFRLHDAADDAVALLDVLGVEQAVVAGYSMGGPVAMLAWRRHPERVRGLVLCATAPYFASSREERMGFMGMTGLAAVSRATPAPARQWLTDQFFLSRRARHWEPWALEQVGRHDWRMVLEAGGSLGSFSARDWIGDIDVPTSVIVTMRDHVVPVRRQLRLAAGIPHAHVERVDGMHDAVVANAERFVPAFVRGLHHVIGAR